MIPVNNTLSPVQVKILDTLLVKGMTIKEVADEINISDTYSRTQIQRLESAGRVTKLDNRMPFVYVVNSDDPTIRYEKTVKEYRYALIHDIPTSNSVIEGLRTVPKTQWPEFADKLTAIAEAIRLLDGEGKLIDTL